MAEIGTDIEKARALLVAGELVAIPTETVYGLAGNALNASSVSKIFEVKRRPTFDPLIVHVADFKSVEMYAQNIQTAAKQLAEQYWPGPLTLLLSKKNIIPDLVTAGLDTVGLRCPDHPLTQALLAALPFPLAAPSANPFGYVSPTVPEHVEEQLGSQIKYILDGGACKVGIESTIIGFENDQPIIYRMGGVTIENIESIIGKVERQMYSTSNPKSPGQLQSHYAPHKKVVIGDVHELLKKYEGEAVGILSFQKDFQSRYQVILSAKGDLSEAAQNLFAGLRTLDKFPIDVILAEVVPDSGLGKAINDRLKRASK